MICVGLRPNVISYNTLIDDHCLVGRMDEAAKILDGMVSVDLKPNIISYNTLLHGYCKAGKIDNAYCLFPRNVEGRSYAWSCDLQYYTAWFVSDREVF